MSIHSVIQKKRRELGLTQEYVAESLHVSVPAVSKWENGLTSPDITLLAPLARLLKTDVNTLLCFREEMTQREISDFYLGIQALAQEQGIAAAFAAAEEKLREYPGNDQLLHLLTLLLDGLSTGKPEYEPRLSLWYHQLSESKDTSIRHSARYLLASRAIRQGDYGKAQLLLDQLPDLESTVPGDKKLLQISLDQAQGNWEKALKAAQTLLLQSISKTMMLMQKLLDIHEATGDLPSAREVGEKFTQTAELLQLWEYYQYLAPLQLAKAENREAEAQALYHRMMDSLSKPWDLGQTVLFDRIGPVSDMRHLRGMLEALESEKGAESQAAP